MPEIQLENPPSWAVVVTQTSAPLKVLKRLLITFLFYPLLHS
jgi:hypothetical protein